jgi:hypothetical protein
MYVSHIKYPNNVIKAKVDLGLQTSILPTKTI